MAAAPAEANPLPPLTSQEQALLDRSDGPDEKLAELVWKEGPQQDYPGNAEDPKRLDSWLARGGMTARLAASRSPKALLASLDREGIRHRSSVQHEFWMLRQFSLTYWHQLRPVNQAEFATADRAAASIRKALWAVEGSMRRMTSDRSYVTDMVWAQAEWLLQQSKPGFLAGSTPVRKYGRIPLRWFGEELRNCRDASGALCRLDYGMDHSRDAEIIRTALAEVDECLQFWTPAGKDYLLNELLLVVRDHWNYYYGGSPRPRAVQLLGTGPSSAPTGRIMVTLSQGHREIWDSSPNCISPKIAWSDVSWVKNPKAGGQWLRVVKEGRVLDFKPKGGRIIDHEGFAYSGVTVLSEDEDGGIWLERFSLETRQAIETFSTSDKLPEPFPDWAVPFRSRWP